METKNKPSDKFVINRTFEAPRDLVFQMWTDPKHFSQWLAPTGFTMTFLNDEIKAGSTTFYSMSGGGGMKMYGKATYREIVKPQRLVYTQIFCDEHGNIARHPMSPTWPQTMLTTVLLEEEGSDKTRVTVIWEVFGEATAVEHDTFHKAKAGMTQGWNGSFDKLEAYLLERKKS